MPVLLYIYVSIGIYVYNMHKEAVLEEHTFFLTGDPAVVDRKRTNHYSLYHQTYHWMLKIYDALA